MQGAVHPCARLRLQGPRTNGAPWPATSTVEEELAELAQIVAEAEAEGIDPWPEPKPERPWAKWTIATFVTVMMLSWVSQLLFRVVEITRETVP